MAVITQDKITLQSAKAINDKAEAAQTLAGNTNQHFWFSSSGTDTGAHITELTQEDFVSDPTNGGSNLLARSNGIAIRDGLTELASFGATGSVVGALSSSHIVTCTEGIQLYDSSSHNIATFGEDAVIGRTDNAYGNTRITNTSVILRRGSTMLGSFGGTYYVNGDREIGLYTTDSHSYIELYDDSNNTAPYLEFGLNGGSGTGYPKMTIDTAGITYNGANRVLWQPTTPSASPYLTDTQSITLSEAVSKQLTGIVLVWSRRASGTVYNDSWWYEYIPKWHAMNHGTQGIYMSTPTGFSATVCIKYVYIDDLEITGHASNSATGTGYANNTRVLRAVIGV